MNEPILKVENLVQVYGEGTPFEKVAVNNMSFELYENEFLGVIGQTGSGKSTLIQMLNGLMKPTSGKILFRGEDIWAKRYDRRLLRSKVGLVFQYPEYQLFEVTVEKDIAFGPRNMGLSEEEIADRVSEAMRLTGLSDSLREKSPFELSGGQKRRVAIAGILAMRPRVLILDEPTRGIDVGAKYEIYKLIHQLAEQGKAVILVSSELPELLGMADRIYTIFEGTITGELLASEANQEALMKKMTITSNS